MRQIRLTGVWAALIVLVPACSLYTDFNYRSDGGTNNGNGNNNNTNAVCGNGEVEAGEECDDGNTVSGDGCRGDCGQDETLCGNSTVDTGEECDDGNQDNTDSCVDGCKDATCGDGFLHAGVETCDGTNMGQQTCESLGGVDGDLDCDQCQLDFSGCSCGNGACEPGVGETPTNCAAECGWVTIAGGDEFTCGVRADGTAWCWGSDENGKLGDGTGALAACDPGFQCSATPVQVAGLSDVTHLSAGQHFACALKGDGTVWCWGSDGAGQLGNGSGSPSTCGSTPCSPTPVQVLNAANVETLAVGWSHACIIENSGTLKCWGDNDIYGKVGDDSQSIIHAPVEPELSFASIPNNFAVVSAGRHHTCAYHASTLDNYCWGRNFVGQFGYAADGGAQYPVASAAFGSELSAAGNNTCAIVGGGVSCVGINGWGQLGRGTTTGLMTCNPPDVSCSPSLESVAPVLAGIDLLSIGGNHSCAAASGGSAWCWGTNDHGELGVGSTVGPDTCTYNGSVDCSLSPAQVANTITDVRSIHAGLVSTTCAILNDRTAWCWGMGNRGQLGDGYMTDRSSPTEVVVNY